MKQVFICPRCRSQCVYGQQFCITCGSKLDWGKTQQVSDKQSSNLQSINEITHQEVKKHGVGHWIKNHKFWTSVIILSIFLMAFSYSGFANPMEAGEALGIYILLGGLIWSIQTEKKGYTMITIGSLLIPVTLLSLAVSLTDIVESGILMTIFIAFLSILFIAWGIKRHRNAKRGSK